MLKIKEVIKKGSWLLPYSTYICNTAGFHYQDIPMGNSVMYFSKCSWSPDLTNKYISSLNLSLEANMNDLFRWVDIENFNLCSAPAFQMKAQCMSLKHWEKKKSIFVASSLSDGCNIFVYKVKMLHSLCMIIQHHNIGI